MTFVNRSAKRLEVLLSALIGTVAFALLSRFPELPVLNKAWIDNNFPLNYELVRVAVGGAVAWFFYTQHILSAGASSLAEWSYLPDFLGTKPLARAEHRFLHHGQRCTPLVGRAEELEYLSAFLSTPEPFVWWWLTGDSGIGKSRVALELVEQAKAKKFDAGVFNGPIDALRDWQPRRPTLIVLDDACRLDSATRSMLCNMAVKYLCEQRGRRLHKPVRLLLVDQRQPLALDDIETIGTFERESCFRPNPLHLGLLSPTAVDTLIQSTVARGRERNALSRQDNASIAEAGMQNPFWLLLALSSYHEHGAVLWSTADHLLNDRLQATREKWRMVSKLPAPCEAVLALAAMVKAVDPGRLRKESPEIWEEACHNKERFYRLIGALGSHETRINCPIHNVLKEYFVLQYLQDIEAGRVPASLTARGLRALAFELDPYHSTQFLSQLAARFPEHLVVLELVRPPALGADQPTDVSAWLLLQGHRLRNEGESPAIKEEIVRAVIAIHGNSALSDYDASQDALAWTLANAACWHAIQTLESKRQHVKLNLSHLATRHFTLTTLVESISRRFPENSSIATSLARTYLAGLWYAGVLKGEANDFVISASRALKQLAERWPNARLAYSRALVSVSSRKAPGSEECLNALASLALLHPDILEQYAIGLGGAILAKVGDPESYLAALSDVAKRNPSLTPRYATGLIAAIRNKIGDADGHLRVLHALACKEPELLVNYSSGLVAAIDARQGDVSTHLDKLYDLSTLDPQSTRNYGLGLVAAIRNRAADAQFCLDKLKALCVGPVPLDTYAEGLNVAVNNRAGDVATHLQILSDLALVDPRIRDHYARAISTAIRTNCDGASRHLLTLRDLAAKDLALLPHYVSSLIDATKWDDWRPHLDALSSLAHERPEYLPKLANGLVAAMSAHPQACDESLGTLKELADRKPAMQPDYARGLVVALNAGMGRAENHLESLKALAVHSRALTREYVKGLRLALRQGGPIIDLNVIDQRLSDVRAAAKNAGDEECWLELARAFGNAINCATVVMDSHRIQSYSSALEEHCRDNPMSASLRHGWASVLANSLLGLDARSARTQIDHAVSRLEGMLRENPANVDHTLATIDGLCNTMALLLEANASEEEVERYNAKLRLIVAGDGAQYLATSICRLCKLRVRQKFTERIATNLAMLARVTATVPRGSKVHRACDSLYRLMMSHEISDQVDEAAALRAKAAELAAMVSPHTT